MAYNKQLYKEKSYIYIPEIDKTKIETLFNISNQMDSQQILQYSMIHQVPLYLCNDSKSNNLIHSILQNENKLKNESVRLNIIKYLVNNQVNPDQPNMYNITPLHIACQKQYYIICKYLIEECYVNINRQDNNGFTPTNV